DGADHQRTVRQSTPGSDGCSGSGVPVVVGAAEAFGSAVTEVGDSAGPVPVPLDVHKGSRSFVRSRPMISRAPSSPALLIMPRRTLARAYGCRSRRYTASQPRASSRQL